MTLAGREAGRRGGWSRRAFLGRGAVLGATAAGGSRLLPPPVRRRVVDVAVVGAGLTGLAAAHRLAAAGARIVVLEAGTQAGGRYAPLEAGGVSVDGAPHSVSGGDRDARQLVEACGLRLAAARAPLRPRVPDTAQAGLDRLRLLAAEVDPDRPWACASAAARDAHTVASWLQAAVPDAAARAGLAALLESALGVPLARGSLLWALARLAADDPFTRPLPDRLRVAGGAHQLATRMALLLGDRLSLRCAARRVAQVAGGFRVEAGGLDVRAGGVVLAVPPSTAAGLIADPSRSELRQDLLQHGEATGRTALAVFDRAYWRGGRCVQAAAGCTAWDVGPDAGAPGVLLVAADSPDRPGWPESLAALRPRRLVTGGVTAVEYAPPGVLTSRPPGGPVKATRLAVAARVPTGSPTDVGAAFRAGGEAAAAVLEAV